jgi:hypothetical protein
LIHTNFRTAFFCAALLGSASCAKQEDVIVRTGEGKTATPEAIDADPLALLPGNAVGVATVDAQALFQSSFGSALLAIVRARSPFPKAADFEPSRDLDRVYLGSYSMQGADVAGVAIGRFKPERIAEAEAELMSGTLKTVGGFPIVKSSYAGRTLYTAGGIGFTVLTAKTVLFGNETGIRRALDRIEEGRVKRRLSGWMLELLDKPSAPLAAGADLTAQPLPEAARSELKFLDGVKTVSLLGNFQSPGLNLAGTLTYADADGAKRGAARMLDLHGRLSTFAPFMALLGIPQPVKKLDARAEEDKVRFVMGVDGQAVAVLLDKAQSYLSSFAPPPASSPPPVSVSAPSSIPP